MESLDQLITALEASTRTDPPAEDEIQAALAAALERPTLLTVRHRRPSPYGYRTNQVYAAADGAFSLVAMVWLPGQATTAHHHRSWSALGVCDGALTETTYRVGTSASASDEADDHAAARTTTGEAWADPVHERTLGRGSVLWTPSAARVHALVNRDHRVAVSLHVHGAGHHGRGTASLVSYESTR